MKQSNLAVIGGTGFSEMAQNPEKVETDYGDVQVSTLELGGKQVRFVPRHKDLDVPDLVNYRANIQALVLCGVKTVLAVTAAGRLHKDVLPGHLVVIDDIDWDDATGKNRDITFAESGLLLHASMNDPFSVGLRHAMVESWEESRKAVESHYAGSPDLSVGFHSGGTYFNINGPQFSPPARETRIRNTVINPRLIGQTLFPEMPLAREMGLAYGALGMCVDHSSFPGGVPVKHADGVMHAVKSTAKAAVVVLGNTIKRIPDNFHDPIAHEAFRHSLHPSQVNLKLIASKRPQLEAILKKQLGV